MMAKYPEDNDYDQYPHKRIWRITSDFRPLLQAYGRVWERQAGPVAERGGSPMESLESEVDDAELPIINAIADLEAEAFAAGQKAERERCHGIALGAFLIIAPESLSQRVGAESVRQQIAAAIMEDKSDE